MTCSSEISIGGYELDVWRHSYTLWERFEKRDRIIRSRKSFLCNGEERLWVEFAYSVTADVLRRRLARAGFTWTTLEQEFLRFYQATCRQSGTLFFNPHPDAEKAQARAEAFRAATLDDWLEALAKAVNANVTRVRRNAGEVAHPKDILVDIITGSDSPDDRERMPSHSLLGFPCRSLDHAAVALLEVVSGDVLCEQEVSMFVKYQGDTTFDDMRLKMPDSTLTQAVFRDEEDI
ncbi:hypothetical protein CR51_17685 [Caballeronia megalochromosomata]|nr:hypothetical protein CR51_17685 [Caballeronia megalochromosomata]